MDAITIMVLIFIILTGVVLLYMILAYFIGWWPFKRTIVAVPKQPTGDTNGTNGTNGANGTNGTDDTKQGVYFIGPGGNYVNGLSFEEAKNKCSVNNGGLASKDEVISAGQGGVLNACAYGWVEDGTSGLYIQKATPKCGKAGWNFGSAPSKKNGAWCSGTIPDGLPRAYYEESIDSDTDTNN